MIRKLIKAFLIFILINVLFIIFVLIYSQITINIESKILKGYYKSVEHWDEKGLMDYLDYCKYYYKDSKLFINDKDYQKVKEDDIEKINNRFKEIERWMKINNRISQYDFDYSIVSVGDYYYLDGSSYDNYTIYFFDVESKVLYYAHINT